MIIWSTMGGFPQRRLQPGVVLQHVGENVVVEQRRALGDAGGAAGILQEGDVIGVSFGLLSFWLRPASASLNETAPGDRPGRHHLHHADDQIDDHALEAEQVAHAADDHMLDRGPRDHLLHRGSEILQNDHGFRAGILQLMLELARGCRAG